MHALLGVEAISSWSSGGKLLGTGVFLIAFSVAFQPVWSVCLVLYVARYHAASTMLVDAHLLQCC
ncbi:hypothetical protein N431DRAFT_49538 [Stipitochalara longipes BDJ]|nr:hypothetical protein N431DRAFT_49538 [Stipitochalara longipes BDJ]